MAATDLAKPGADSESDATDATRVPGDAAGPADAIANDGAPELPDGTDTDPGVSDDGSDLDSSNTTDSDEDPSDAAPETGVSVDAAESGSSADAGPTAGVCFHGPPPPGSATGSVPMPADDACPPEPPLFFGTAPIPQPTLQVQVGWGDPETGAFLPYQDGDWVPIVHGQQGGMHVLASFRVVLPGQTAAKVKLQTRGASYIECDQAGLGDSAIVYAVEALAPETYSNVMPAKEGMYVIFPEPGGQSALYCGKWLDLHLQVRLFGTSAWGEVRRRLRLYDTLAGP